jgi:hypothetical protein
MVTLSDTWSTIPRNVILSKKKKFRF